MSNFLFSFSNKKENQIVNYKKPTTSKENKSITNVESDQNNYTKAKLWGPLTWMLFHTLANFVNNFQEERLNLIKVFKLICNNLPCPYCRDDANNFIRSFNFNTLLSKRDFKLFIFDFHNRVSLKLKKQPKNESILEKYNNIDLLRLLNIWYTYFTRYGIENSEFIESINRNNARNEVHRYISNNLHKFTNS